MIRSRVIIEDLPPTVTGKFMDEVRPEAASEGHGLLFNALLYPNRSLPNTGFYVVMTIVIVVNLGSMFFSWVNGAWPVIFFAGADIFAVWLAFKLSYRQGRLHERIMLSEDELWVCRVLPTGHETRWKLMPYWTRAEIDDPVRHESQLCLVSHGRRLILGAFLSPKERGELAVALSRSLEKARTRKLPE